MVPALSLRDVTKIYKRSHLGRATKTTGIAHVSLDISPGEIFGLLGLNGSGKTTTIKLILGLLFPTEGELRVQGQAVPSPKAQAQLGYLPEVPYFAKFLTAEELLRFYAKLSNVPDSSRASRINQVLELVRMAPHRSRKLKEFSKGMLQRIGLASALVHDPSILIFDEPATGLDPLGLREIRELMVHLNSQGKTIFFSSHSISEVEKICHRVGILAGGRLVKVLSQDQWGGSAGHLEEIFVETVQPTLAGGI